MMDVAAVVAAAAGSRGIGYDGKMVSAISHPIDVLLCSFACDFSEQTCY
jgi:hypothetical protein